jgi:hypothetical protein
VSKRKTFYFDKTVEVEVDEEDLAEAGYHHEDACPAKSRPGDPYRADLADALASLHRQAHPGASPEIFACPEEPCRSLGMDQIGYGGRPAAAAKPTVTVRTGGRT